MKSKFLIINILFLYFFSCSQVAFSTEFIYGFKDIYLKDSLSNTIKKIQKNYSLSIEEKSNFLYEIFEFNPYEFLDFKKNQIPFKIYGNTFFLNLKKINNSTNDYRYYSRNKKSYFQFFKIKRIHITEKENLKKLDEDLKDISFLFFNDVLYAILYSLNLKIPSFEGILKDKINLHKLPNEYKEINEYLFEKLYSQNPFFKILHKEPKEFVSMTITNEDRTKNLNPEAFIEYEKSKYKYTSLKWMNPFSEFYLTYSNDVNTILKNDSVNLNVAYFDTELYKKVNEHIKTNIFNLKKYLNDSINKKKKVIANYFENLNVKNKNKFFLNFEN